MQHLPKAEPAESNSLVYTHHDVLSVARPVSRAQNLLPKLAFGPADPLAALLRESPAASQAMLPNVVLEPVEEQAPAMTIVGEEAPLSKCALWDMLIRYYQNMGINAWENNVPCFITSNAYIAESYADLVINFLHDYAAHIRQDEPVYIVELATGTGRFSFNMLTELQRKLTYFSSLSSLKIRYVMTDFTEANLTFWANHEKLKPFVESGLLDFAIMNPLVENRLDLRVSGLTVSSETVTNPVIAIANYFFDSIPQDVFRVEGSTLMEGLVTLERNLSNGVDPESEPHVSQIKPHYRYQPLRHARYYNDERLNAVLEHYRREVRNGTFLFPIGAFDVLRNMRAMSNDNLVLISSDKAYTEKAPMLLFAEHEYAVHDGAFSFMVNYDAIGQAFRQDGGHYLFTTDRSLSVQTVCCIGVRERNCGFERTRYNFEEKVNRWNPTNSICNVMPEDEKPVNKKIDELLSFIRLNLSDPRIFNLVTVKLTDYLDVLNHGQKEDLLAMMRTAWERFYYFPGESNMPFSLSELYFRMEMSEDSLRCLDLTIACYGPHHALYYLKGQNFERMNRLEEAHENFARAAEMCPEFTEAQEALNNIRAKMTGGGLRA